VNDARKSLAQLVVKAIDSALEFGYEPHEHGLIAETVVAAMFTADPAEPDGGWLIVQEEVHRVVECDQVGENEGYRGWTVLVLSNPEGEDDDE